MITIDQLTFEPITLTALMSTIVICLCFYVHLGNDFVKVKYVFPANMRHRPNVGPVS